MIEGAAETPAPSPLGDRVIAEIEALREALTPTELALAALAVVGAVLFARAFSALARVAWQLGFDAERTLAAWAGGVRVASFVALALLAASALFSAAPLVTTVGLTLTVPCLVLVLAPTLQSVVVGLELALRRRLREGDRVLFGGASGIVQRIGLTHVHLRSPEGNTRHIPARLFARQVLEVERARNAVPVTVRVPLSRPPTPQLVESARRVAALCPYRVPGSALAVPPWTRRAAELAVEIHVWSEDAVSDARTQLDAQLRRLVDEASPSGGARAPLRNLRRADEKEKPGPTRLD